MSAPILERSAAQTRLRQHARRVAGAIIGLSLFALGWPRVHAAYPDKPIRIVIGSTAGSSTDTLCRLIGTKLTERFGQPVVVENRPGASTRIAADLVARAAPDGYTFLAQNAVTMNFGLMFKGMSYEPKKDFTPVILLGRVPTFLFVNQSLPVSSLSEFVSYARNKGNLVYGSGGSGSASHLAAEALAIVTGIHASHVAYKGNQPAGVAVAAGEVAYSLNNYDIMRAFMVQGKVKPLAVFEPKRSSLLPDVPTVAELGLPRDVEGIAPWYILSGPPNLPAEVTELMNRALNEILQMKDVQERLKALTIEPGGGTTDDAEAFFRANQARWHRIIQQRRISIAE